jgi:epsin
VDNLFSNNLSNDFLIEMHSNIIYIYILYFSFNQAKPKTDLEAKIYEVLSHKNWGSSSTLMNELSRDTFDYDKFAVISQLTWEAMENQRPAAWRVVFKGLTLLEHLIKNGSERCVDDARSHGHTLRSLHQFNYYEGTIDRGLGVREKSKQIVDILADDERIREERQKARKLREKFGGSLGGTGSTTGGGSSSNAYAGYGNDNWDRGGGGGGGYGDGGIGSKSTGGRYDDERMNSNAAAGGYSGRYDNDASTSAVTATPTFAALSDDVPKKTKGKKKKKDTTTSTATVGEEVDFFSFDEPNPAPVTATAATADDDFDNFQSAPGNGSAPTLNATTLDDPFGTAPAPPIAVQQPVSAQFDLFGSGGNLTTSAGQQPSFEAFGSGNSNHSSNIMGGSNMMMMQQQQQQPMMGGNAMMGYAMTATGGNTMNGMQPHKQQQMPSFQTPDDDFGDFAVATQAPINTTKMNAMSNSSSKPLSTLISLDGLSKNSSNAFEDKLNQPIIANAAAATFVHEKEQIQASVKQSGVKGSSMSFAGIDGLHKSSLMSTPMGGFNPSAMMMMAPPASSMGNINPSVMGGSGGASSSMIGMLDPSEMTRKPGMSSSTVPPQGMMMNASTMSNNNTNGMMYPTSSTTSTSMPMAMNGMGMMNASMTTATQQQQQQSFGMMMPQQQQQTMMNQGYGVGGNNMQPGFSAMGGMPPQGNSTTNSLGMGMSGQPNWNVGSMPTSGMGQQNNGFGGQATGGFR